MSAQTNAQQSFSVREKPWWDSKGESVRPDYPLTIAEARQWANLEWDPIGEPIYKLYSVDDGGTPVYKAMDGHQRVVNPDRPEVDLGVVTNTYEPIGNDVPFELVAHMIDKRPLGVNGEVPEIGELDNLRDLGIEIETGGFLGDGETVWVCAKLDQPLTLPGDFSMTQQFVTGVTAHDGSGALKVFGSFIRAVCANTIKAGEMQATADNTLYSFRHTANWREKVNEAKKTIRGTRENFEKLAAIYEELDSVTIDEAVTETFIQAIVPGLENPKLTDRSKTFIKADQAKIRQMLASPTTLPMADKALGLWLAAGEFFDHGRRYRTRDTYVRRTLIEPQVGKLIALDLLHEITGAKVGPKWEASDAAPKVLATASV